MNGRFCVEGYINEDKVFRYAFRLVRDPLRSKAVDAPEEGCLMDIQIGIIISWILYVPH